MDCSEVFKDTKLSLLVWHRLDQAVHQEALRFMKELMTNATLAAHVMPLLRPAGRTQRDYDDWQTKARQTHGTPPAHCAPAGQSHLYCELWFQVQGQADAALWQKVQGWVNGCGHGWALHDIGSAPENHWQPLADRLERCQYLECNPSGGEIRWCEMPKEQIPWALKVVWYRASEVLCEHLAQPTSDWLLNPQCDRDRILRLLAEILSDINLNRYGIADSGTLLDPSRFGVSHMAAFAMNAVTAVEPPDKYRLDQYWPPLGDNATWPHRYPKLQDYLDAIRSA